MFENEINKVLSIGSFEVGLKEIKNILSVKISEDFYKLFFCILKKNNELINSYNSVINTVGDVYKLLQVSKFCLEIILKSQNVSELNNNIPKYMFREKNNFIFIFNKLNKNKKGVLIGLVFKTELLIRKNNNQFFEIGNRFLLNIKKNISGLSV